MFIMSATNSTIVNDISVTRRTYSVNSIPIMEKLISIKNEAFNSFNNILPLSLSLIKSIVLERKKEREREVSYGS